MNQISRKDQFFCLHQKAFAWWHELTHGWSPLCENVSQRKFDYIDVTLQLIFKKQFRIHILRSIFKKFF